MLQNYYFDIDNNWQTVKSLIPDIKDDLQEVLEFMRDFLDFDEMINKPSIEDYVQYMKDVFNFFGVLYTIYQKDIKEKIASIDDQIAEAKNQEQAKEDAQKGKKPEDTLSNTNVY